MSERMYDPTPPPGYVRVAGGANLELGDLFFEGWWRMTVHLDAMAPAPGPHSRTYWRSDDAWVVVDELEDEKLAELWKLLKPATEDEIGIVAMLARKLMGEGRREYGPLSLKTDDRTVGDIVRDSCDELVDTLFYMFLAKTKIEQGFTGVDRTKDSNG